MSESAIKGELVRTAEGQFIEGTSGNVRGRPKGSKNKITLLKLGVEEAVRERNAERIQIVLDLIIQSALDGDKDARKLVWDACMSKAVPHEDKTAGQKQQITVHRMEVTQSKPEEDTHE